MDPIRNYTETFDVYYDFYSTEICEDTFHYPKIPHIIDLNKKYSTFTVHIPCEEESMLNKRDGLNVNKCELINNIKGNEFENIEAYEVQNSEFNNLKNSDNNNLSTNLNNTQFNKKINEDNSTNIKKDNEATNYNLDEEQKEYFNDELIQSKNTKTTKFSTDNNIKSDKNREGIEYINNSIKKNKPETESIINNTDKTMNSCYKKSIQPNIPSNSTNTKIILLKYSTRKCSITLNYKYFTPSHLFTKFSIPPITSFQTIGHILHLNLDKIHTPYKHIIGNIYLDKIKNIKTVISKKSSINTQFRYFEYDLLAGHNKLITIHYESNLKYYIDYSKVYWNGKLQNERMRLAKELAGTVCDPFCGVGPLVLNCLRNKCDVICNDLNGDAIECLKKSMEYNKGTLKGKCEIYNLDAEKFIGMIVENNVKVDVFVFNLPEYSLRYVRLLREYGKVCRVIVYFFARSGEEAKVMADGSCWFVVNSVKWVRSVAPSKDMYKIDEVINIKKYN